MDAAGEINLYHCHGLGGNQAWFYEDQQIIHKPTKKCVTHTANDIVLGECSLTSVTVSGLQYREPTVGETRFSFCKWLVVLVVQLFNE